MIGEAEQATTEWKKKECITKCKTFKTEMIMNIIGRLTRDAEVRTLNNDKQVVNFTVAVNDNYKNKDGERIEQTSFFDCSYWKTPNVVRMLTKGLLVQLTGRVTARAWVGRDGEAKAGLNFHTSDIKPLGGSKRNETTQASQENILQPLPDDLPF